LNTYPSQTLTIVLYTDRQFQDVTRAAGLGRGRLRRTDPPRGRRRPPQAGGAGSAGAARAGNAVIDHAAPRNVPAWVHEGLASVLESTDRSWIARALRG
jgi:hypothetical protein